MSFAFTGKQFFFIGKAAAHRDFSDVPPLDPRTYTLCPGDLPLKGDPTPTRKVEKAVEDALQQIGGIDAL